MACCESQSLKMPLLSCTSCWVASSVRLVSGFFIYFNFLFLSQVGSVSDASSEICRNGFFPRRDHLGVHLGSRKPRSLREMEETRKYFIWHPATAQARKCLAYFFGGDRHPQYLILFWGNFYGLDTRTYLCVCSTLRSSSSCSSLFYPSGDRKFQGTRLLPHTYTKCRWRARSGISWTMTSSTGHG